MTNSLNGMHLHIEGPDADLLMSEIDGRGTLRITDDNGHIAHLHSWKTQDVYARIGSYFCHRVGVEFIRLPNRYPSLRCSMAAAMRGMGWSGKETGANSVTVEQFMSILRRHSNEEGWHIDYIEIGA